MSVPAVDRDASESALLRSPALSPETILARAGGENFPVAPRFLPRAPREALVALYGFARLVDQIGDEAAGDRAALLDALEADLERAYGGVPLHPLLRRLARAIERHQLPRAAFERLIAANREAQARVRIADFDALIASCALSANPVGELVLHVFGAASPERVQRSDAVCSALQVIEHCQDVAEDFASGRIYLPARDLAAAGCAQGDLTRAPASPELRAVIALQIERARGLLAEARPLVSELRGLARAAVASYAAGGLAACDAFAAAGFDPNSRRVRGRRRDLARHALSLYWGRA